MTPEITTINLWQDNFIFKASCGVNAYLVKTGDGFVLIDTGFRARRKEFLMELARLGCAPNNLRLVIITHADMDHTGNAAALRQAYRTKIGVQPGEAEATSRGNMWLSRKNRPAGIASLVFSFFSWLTRADRFDPDLTLVDGQELIEFGFKARVIDLPGHSQGSIGVLTAAGDLFCGDLLTNIDRPAANTLVDDPAELQASLDKLDSLAIRTIYPGHGQPFQMAQFSLPPTETLDGRKK